MEREGDGEIEKERTDCRKKGIRKMDGEAGRKVKVNGEEVGRGGKTSNGLGRRGEWENRDRQRMERDERWGEKG